MHIRGCSNGLGLSSRREVAQAGEAMTRRMTAFILTCITVLAAIVPLSACATPAQTQEEFRTEFVEMLKELDVVVTPENKEHTPISKIVKLDEGVEIYEDELIIDMHVYELSHKPDIAPPTAQEIESLYTKYDDDIYNRFEPFYNWYSANGNWIRDGYESGLIAANSAYWERNGYYFFDTTDWSQWTREKKFELEKYVKENPDYEQTSSKYRLLLALLGLDK